MHECFIWLPAVRGIVVTSPSDQELHGRSSLVITAMRKDLLYHELLLVLLRNVLRINLSRVEDKGSQIVNRVRICLPLTKSSMVYTDWLRPST